MPTKITIVKNTDGSKKVIIGTKTTSSNNTKFKPTTNSKSIDRRPKPGTPKIGLTNERNGYKYGGKSKVK